MYLSNYLKLRAYCYGKYFLIFCEKLIYKPFIISLCLFLLFMLVSVSLSLNAFKITGFQSDDHLLPLSLPEMDYNNAKLVNKF